MMNKKENAGATPNTFVKVLKWIWNRLKHNFGLKILSVIFAVILWGYVLTTTNPQRDKTLSNMPIQVANAQLVEDRGLAIVEDIENTVSARTVIRANNERLSDVSTDNVSAYVDLSQITSEGTYTLDVQASTVYGSVQKISPSSITVTVERRASKTLNIEALIPEAEDGTYATAAELYPSQVTVTGATSVLANVDSAYVELDPEDVKENVVRALPIRYYDAEKQTVTPNVSAEINSSLLTVHYYPTQRVPIELNSEITAAEGYEIVSIEMLRDSVIVAAASENLPAIKAIQTEVLVATNLKETNTYETTFIQPDGAISIEPQRVRVKITVRQTTERTVLENMNVFPVYGQEMNSAAIAQNVNVAPVSVVLRGPIGVTIQRSDIRLYVDVTNAENGDEVPLLLYWAGSGAKPEGLSIVSPETVVLEIDE